jgi:hypothetical protein
MTLVWSPGYAPVDEHYDNVSLLLYGNGTNGSTTITDNSPTPKTVTAVGNAQISTAQSKFGGSSLLFDGAGDYLTVTEASSSFTFATDNFTIEFWLYPSNLIGIAVILDWRNVGGPQGDRPTIYRNGSNLLFFAGSDLITGTSALTNQLFQHIALTKSSGSTRLFVNGTQVGSTYSDSKNYLSPQGGTMYAGAVGNGTSGMAGYIDDLRITKGVARYTANFTPPTESFPDLSPTGRLAIP